MVRQIILFLFILILPVLSIAEDRDLSKAVPGKPAKDSLIVDSDINDIPFNSTVISSDQIDKLPVRDFQSIIANRPGLSIHNNDIHIRGGRDDEVGYYINGVSAINPVTNRNAVYVIPEAIDYLQILPGNFNAEMGGYISGIINSELKTGGSRLKGSIDFRTDGFGNQEQGIKWFNTYVYGHQTGVATLSGPLISDKINFFVAGEYRRRKDNAVRFSEGFEFNNLTNMNDGHEDSISISYSGGFTPNQEFVGKSLNATVTFDLPVKITLGALYQNDRSDVCTAPMLNILNDRIPYNDYTSTLLTSKFTKTIGDQSLLEVQLSYFNADNERGDSWFGHDWEKWYDSTAVYDYSENHYDEPVVYNHDTYYGILPDYNLNGFYFSRNGDILNRYFHNKQQYVGVKADYQLKVTDHHEAKVGIDWRQYSIRHFDIAPTVMGRITDKNFTYIDIWSSIEEMPADRWQEYGDVNFYGYDIYGNEIDKEKKYYDDEGNLLAVAEAPKKPFKLSVYLQDQITYNNLVLNAGVRIDYFNADDKDLKNPTSPTVMETADFIAEEAWQDHGPFLEIQPRFGFSFIPGPKTLFFFQYGKFVQMPEYSEIYSSTPNTMTQRIIQSRSYYKNPIGFGLEPIKSNNFEFGWRQKINQMATINITGFYKNTTNLVKTVRTSLPSDRWYVDKYYLRFENGDFSLARGVELELVFDRVKRLMGRVNYTYTDAQGIGSNSTAYQSAVYYDAALPQTIHPLNFSRKHDGLINLDYRFGQSDGGTILSQSGLNLLFKFSSGHPYTSSKAYAGSGELYKLGVYYMDDTRGVTFIEPIGSSTTPWTFTTDLKVDKTFDIGRYKVTVYVVINNLFNRKNILNVYENTGSTDNDGFGKSVKHSAKYYGGQKTIDMYQAINLTNGQSYWDVLGKELWGQPRQIHLGVKLAF